MKAKIILSLLFFILSPALYAKQWIIFCSDKAGLHAFVTLVKENPTTKVPTKVGTWGFHPFDDPWYTKLLFEKGAVYDNSNIKAAQNRFMSEVTDSEWNACLATIDRYSVDPYSITHNNCIDFLVAIAENIVFLNHIPSTKVSPWLYAYAMKVANPEWAKYSELSYAFSMHNTKAKQTTTETKQATTETKQALSNGAALLFKNIKTKLSVDEKNYIFTKLGFVIAKDKKGFALKNGEEYPFDVLVLPTDMNNDGVEEIFVSYGNTYTSGNTANHIILFIKSGKNYYEENLNFPGLTPEALTTSNQGYMDLLIGLPGFTFPIWRWNGYKYVLHRKIKDGDWNKIKKTNIETVSQIYQKKGAK